MGEDEKKKLKEDIQSFVDATNKNLETIFKAKEEDTMTI
jgi:ribosome recycling factor